jgi:threonine synthase
VFLTHLTCSACGTRHGTDALHNLCAADGKPLLAEYDLAAVGATVGRHDLAGREASLWRYRELLPVPADVPPVTLGEGWTPLLPAPRLGAALGLDRLYIKDEALNPTGSFKARGMAVAVSMAQLLGATALAVPSAGNAGGALAAYAARAGLPAHVVMPRDTPRANVVECEQAGAEVTLIDGLITDCGRVVAERAAEHGWFDVSTLKEPYRVEGKKTMGYELAEQLGWRLPDVIVYPTGGGTGLIGMWKAFAELQELGWVDAARPRMVSGQAAGCAPIVHAFEAGTPTAAEVVGAHTVAAGLRVPRAIGDFLMLDILRRSGGRAVAVPDAELLAAVGEVAAATGVFAAPEGAACVPALRRLVADGHVRRDELVVMFNTGSGLKYLP